MEDDTTRGDLQGYLERWGMLFELLGATRMMGRILAWLLVCDPPEQSAGDIAEAVRVRPHALSPSPGWSSAWGSPASEALTSA